MLRYIELNPVRADMVAHPRDYLVELRLQCTGREGDQCRLADAASGISTSGAKRGGATKRLSAIVCASLSGQDLDAIRESTHKGWALGSEKFKRRSRPWAASGSFDGGGQAKKVRTD